MAARPVVAPWPIIQEAVMSVRSRALALLGGLGLTVSTLAVARPLPQDPSQPPRPGLTAQQSKQAVELVKGAMKQIRQQTEGAEEPQADRREYIVNVELLGDKGENRPRAAGKPKSNEPAGKQPGAAAAANPRAVVTSYRYFDDTTMFSTVDLKTGRVVEVQTGQHVPTPLSDGEFDEAVAMARERSDEVKRLYERFKDQLSVYGQFSQFVVEGDPRRHRVVHLNYRVGKRDLSYPRPQVDLTTRRVTLPAPEADPNAPAPPPRGNGAPGAGGNGGGNRND